jgi:hypothetical protein
MKLIKTNSKQNTTIGPRFVAEIIRPAQLGPTGEATFNLWAQSEDKIKMYHKNRMWGFGLNSACSE